MSLLSRSSGGGRRTARMAAVFAGTLLTYLVVTAIPAAAAPVACVDSATQLDINLVADETVAIAVGDAAGAFPEGGGGAAGDYFTSVFNTGTGTFGAWTACGAGPDTWVTIDGTDAGAENVILWLSSPGFGADNIIVDLGNGTDSLTLDYGGFAAPPYPLVWADPAGADIPTLATNAFGDLVAEIDDGDALAADISIADAENVTVNLGSGGDTMDAAGSFDALASSTDGVATADDIRAAGNPWPNALTANGGLGDDTFLSGDGNDTFNGGTGTDTVAYSSILGTGFTAVGAVDVNLGTAAATGMGTDTVTDMQNADGSDNDDILTGSSLNNVLTGGLGLDTIDGAAGDDTLNGGGGNDTFLEGTADNGADTVNGDAGAADTVDLRGRTSALYIEPGVAASSGEGGCPLGAGCEGDTYAITSEVYLLGSGADTFVGSAATAETVMPGAGDDDVDGGAGGVDYLDLSDAAGPAVFDMITGEATGNGTDTFADVEGFVGTDADDSVLLDDVSGPPTDFVGGAGIDTVDASASTGGVVIILTAYTSAPPDVENVIGGSGGDTLTGNALGNSIWGNDGFDVIAAGDGNDFVEGGTGNDTLGGGAGGDTLSYVNSTTGMIIDTQLGFTEGIGGVGDGEDSLAGFEIVKGSDFGDEIIAGQTDADFNARLLGRGGDDIIVGTNSSDLIKGGGGDDYARGGGGDDDVYGAAGDDILLGSSGDDFLKGGKGFDEGNGGRGADICRSLEIQKSC